MSKLLDRFHLPFRNFILASIVINVLTIVAILVLKNTVLPPEVPLFYGLPGGQDQLAPSLYLIIPSIISILITLINVSLAAFVKDNFLKKSLIVSGVFSVLFPLATTLKIIFLVGSF